MRKSKLAVLTVALGLLSCAAIGCGSKSTETSEVVSEEVTSEATSEEVTEEVTTEEEVKNSGVYNDLTGEWVDRDEEYGRPISIMLNNISDSMPQCGVGQADVIYEYTVEGGITRLLGIFNDYSDIEKLGSVRSCRPYYVTTSMEYDAIYFHYGQSPQGEEILASSGIDHVSGLDAEGSVAYYRASDRESPHNVFTNSDMIKAGIEYKKYSTEHSDDFESMFSFNKEVKTPENGETANKISTPISSYTSPWFEYNSEDGLYYRFQYGTEHVDGNTGEQLAFENVIIQLAHYTSIDDHDRQEIDLVGSGTGYYASNGVIVPITWKKSSDYSQTKFYTEDGNELKLNPGKTWITVFETDREDKLSWE